MSSSLSPFLPPRLFQWARRGLVAALLLAGWAGAGGGAGAAEPQLGLDNRALLGAPQGVPLSGENLDRVTHDVAARMRCPVCQGLSVADSPTDSALAMKAEVRDLLAAGYTPEQVLDYFEGAYGEFIRLAPKTQGFNWTVWLAPVAALLIGAGIIAGRVRRRAAAGSGGAEAAGAAPPPDASENAELAEYLARVRREVGG